MADIINPFLMLAGIGMMAVAAIAVAYWKRRSSWKWFSYGALVWIAAIAVKLAMDMTITQPVENGILDLYGMAAVIAFASVYVGLRTGFFESGFTYLFAKKRAKKNKAKITFNDAVAFGIGFGALEAFLLGLMSFLNILAIYLYPALLDPLGAVQKDMVISALSQSTLVVIPAIIERVAVVFIHAFAAVLAIASVNTKRAKYIWGSVAYKSVTDGIVPLLPFIAGSGLLSSFAMEVPFVVLAVIGYFGIREMRSKFREEAK